MIKIRSGGQRGIDQIALLTARECGLPTTGFVPKGFRVQDSEGNTTYDDKELIDKSQSLFEATNGLVQKVREELKITQELAGTGMAVEKATHDTMSLLKRLRENVNGFVSRLSKKEITEKELKEFFLELEEGLEFIYQELQVLQPLFRVARKVTKDVSIEDVARRVAKYFKKDLNGEISVNFEVDEDVVVRTNTGLILQVLLNLMDNAIYWLKQSPTKDKEIKIKIDGKNHQIIFSDSGIGIDKDIQEVIFSEFYSKKEEGRGLGLYIVKELLDRIDAEIEIVQSEKRKILKGANFLIQFKEEK
jgi:signal transduction histidine kinase